MNTAKDMTIRVERPEMGITRLVMARPEKFNALNRAMVGELDAAIADIESDGTRVLILAAEGRGFCAGADLKERAGMTEVEKFAHNRAIAALGSRLHGSPLPTIAALNGLALGGGCELALACDLRLMTEGATIGLTETRIGAMPGAGGTQRLPRLIGPARALEMMYGGEPVDAATALEWGLVNHVTADDALYDACLDLARRFVSRSPRTAARLKQVVWSGLDTTLAAGLDIEKEAILEIFASADYAEGLKAFAEKRQPIFK